MMENSKNQSLLVLLSGNNQLVDDVEQMLSDDVANVRLSVNILGIILGAVGILLNSLLIASIVIWKSSNKIAGSTKMSRTMILSLATADLLLLLVGNIKLIEVFKLVCSI